MHISTIYVWQWIIIHSVASICSFMLLILIFMLNYIILMFYLSITPVFKMTNYFFRFIFNIIPATLYLKKNIRRKKNELRLHSSIYCDFSRWSSSLFCGGGALWRHRVSSPVLCLLVSLQLYSLSFLSLSWLIMFALFAYIQELLMNSTCSVDIVFIFMIYSFWCSL